MSALRTSARSIAIAIVVAVGVGTIATVPAQATSKRRSVVIGTCRFRYRVAAMGDDDKPTVTDASCMIRNRDALDAARTPTMTYSGKCVTARNQSWHIEAGTFAKLNDGYFVEWSWTIGSDGTHWVDFGTKPQAGDPDCLITARLWS